MTRILFFLSIFLIAPALRAQKFSCAVSVPTIQFGSYTGSRSTSGVAPLSITCPGSASYTISLRPGSGTLNPGMTGPHDSKLRYKVFQNASRTIPWGDNVGVDTVSSTGTGLNQTFNIYPDLIEGQKIPSGIYSDMLMIIVRSSLGTSTISVPVAAAVIGACTVSATSLNFGNYTGAQLPATSTITVSNCILGTVNIGLNAGTSMGATVTTRKMSGSGSNTLSYALYQDSGYTKNWGMTVGTDTLSANLVLSSVSLTVYGLVTASQYPAPGSYTDTIVATVTY